MIEAEKAVLEGMEIGLEAARAGQQCQDCRSLFGTLEKYGIVKDNRAGYAIGLSYPPDWGERTMSIRRDETVLKENMTFHFMTGLWMEDWGLRSPKASSLKRARLNVWLKCRVKWW